MIKLYDKKNNFFEMFDNKTGFYMRSGIIDENGKDTNVDPFMRFFPGLIDVGIMGHCVHGSSGLCAKSGIQCYQNGLSQKEPNMTLDNFKKIVMECKDKVYQFALGGRGDVDQHENFEDILKLCCENNIVPNFTSSGLGFTNDIAKLCKKYCGAVAISSYSRLKSKRIKFNVNDTTHDNIKDIHDNEYMGNDSSIPDGYIESSDGLTIYYEDKEYTNNAIQLLLNNNVKTNIHFVLGNNTIDEAILRLKYNLFPKGINAVIFLLHKPVGLGQKENMLSIDDDRLKEFFKLVDTNEFNFKIGFDSCSVPGIINMTTGINHDSIDTCEGGRWSCYITSDMKMLPCSFDNQELKWAYDISNDTIKNAWNSKQFEDFRNHFRNSCSKCSNKNMCMGGCPIRRQIVLCNRKEKDLQ